MWAAGDYLGVLSQGLIALADYVAALSHGLLRGQIPVNVIDFDAPIVTVLDFDAPVCTVIDFDATIQTAIDFSEGSPVDIDPRVGDTGTKFRLRVVNESEQPVNVASMTVTITMIRSGRKQVFATILDTTGADGKVYFLTLADTWDQTGVWKAQAHASGSGRYFSSKEVEFSVGKKY